MPTNYRVITYATKTGGYFDAFLESARRHGIRVDVLGWKETWQGFGNRALSVLSHIEKLPPDEVVIFVDSYDVIFLRPLDEMVSEYRQVLREVGPRIVVSTHDQTFGPLGDVIMSAVFGDCKGRYLNAGTFIGLAGLLRRALTLMCSDPTTCRDPDADDQRLLTSVCKDRPELFLFDRNFRWFLIWSLLDHHIEKDVHISADGRLTFKDHDPFILHCPGNKDMSPILSKLGYQHRPSEARSFTTYAQGIYRNHLKHLGRKCRVTIVLLLCVMLFFAVRRARANPKH